MYFRNFLSLTGLTVLNSGSPIPKFWSSNPGGGGINTGHLMNGDEIVFTRTCSSSIQLTLTVNICGFCCSGQLGDVKLEDLPGPEALLRPGER